MHVNLFNCSYGLNCCPIHIWVLLKSNLTTSICHKWSFKLLFTVVILLFLLSERTRFFIINYKCHTIPTSDMLTECDTTQKKFNELKIAYCSYFTVSLFCSFFASFTSYFGVSRGFSRIVGIFLRWIRRKNKLWRGIGLLSSYLICYHVARF